MGLCHKYDTSTHVPNIKHFSGSDMLSMEINHIISYTLFVLTFRVIQTMVHTGAYDNVDYLLLIRFNMRQQQYYIYLRLNIFVVFAFCP